MWDLPGPGIEPISPALAGRFLTTGPPGKPLQSRFEANLPPALTNSLQSGDWCQLREHIPLGVLPSFYIYKTFPTINSMKPAFSLYITLPFSLEPFFIPPFSGPLSSLSPSEFFFLFLIFLDLFFFLLIQLPKS